MSVAGERFAIADRVQPHTTLVVVSFLALLWALAARVFGPSDLWDQTQIRTVSYTTDIIVNGGWHWIVPIERGQEPATKPPLYNWLAVPAVLALGFDSEIGHKLPSVVALCACWLTVVRLGRRFQSRSGTPLGWLAGLCLVCNYGMFKLGYLARPDMVLTLWLMLGWILSTMALQRPAPHWSIAAGFWACLALAGLTKGPAAIVGLASAIVTARLVQGSWTAVRMLRPIRGLMFVVTVTALWVALAWRISPDHVVDELWFNEFVGRVLGTGDEGRGGGARGWITSLPFQPFYFLTRMLPWSLPAIGGIIVVMRRHRRADPAAQWAWPLSAAVFVLITLGMFTLSAGKRADYIAVAFPPAALLAAWWLGSKLRHERLVPISLGAAAVTLTVLTVHHQRNDVAPVPGFGDHIMDFVREANRRMADEPLPSVFCWTGQTHLLAVMGQAREGDRDDVMELVQTGRPFWMVSGRKGSRPHDVGEWIANVRPVQAKAILRTPMMPRAEGWLEQVTLFRVTPTGDRALLP